MARPVLIGDVEIRTIAQEETHAPQGVETMEKPIGSPAEPTTYLVGRAAIPLVPELFPPGAAGTPGFHRQGIGEVGEVIIVHLSTREACRTLASPYGAWVTIAQELSLDDVQRRGANPVKSGWPGARGPKFSVFGGDVFLGLTVSASLSRIPPCVSSQDIASV